MSIKSGLFAGITTVVLILALGNDWIIERARDGTVAQITRGSVTGQLQLPFGDLPSDLRGPQIVHLVLLVALAFVLGGIAGRARPLAAFLGGWAAFLVAAAVSSGIYVFLVDEQFRSPGDDAVDRFTLNASFGTALGMWMGWLVGLAVLLGSFGKGQPKPATAYAPPPPAGSWGAPPAPAWDQPPAPAPQAWEQPPPPAPAPQAWEQPAAPAPPSPGGPQIGAPPDRTQIYGEPNRDA